MTRLALVLVLTACHTTSSSSALEQDAGERIGCLDGSPCQPTVVDLPTAVAGSVSDVSHSIVTYDVSKESWEGPEHVYAFTTEVEGKLTVRLDAAEGLAVFLVDLDANFVAIAGGESFDHVVEPGRYWVVVDSLGTDLDGTFALELDFDETPDEEVDEPHVVSVGNDLAYGAMLTPEEPAHVVTFELGPLEVFDLLIDADQPLRVEVLDWEGAQPDESRDFGGETHMFQMEGDGERRGSVTLEIRAEDADEMADYWVEARHSHR